MFSCPTKHPKLLNAEAKIHGLGSFMCSGLVKGEMQSSCDTFSGLGHEFSFLQHVTGTKSRKILVRRPWIRSCNRSPSPLSSGSWIVETRLPGQQPLARARDEGKFVDNTGNTHLVSNQLTRDFDFENKFGFCELFSRSNQPVEEPWLLESCVPFQSVASSGVTGQDKIAHELNTNIVDPNSSNHSILGPENTCFLNNMSSKPHISERDYPVEEPWLFQSSLLLHEANIGISNNGRSAENLEPQDQRPQIVEMSSLDEVIWESVGNETEDQEPINELEEAPKELFLDDESRVALQKESVSKVILINSSLCTMQRIAVMEDEKLVEILLEPVKNNVQSDSIYIGVVTKFVPHMGGAFVNIGCSRPSLMDTSQNKEPFIFPPFRRHIKQINVNGSLLDTEQAKVIENIERDVIDDSVENMHDDYGEHDMGDEFDVSEYLPRNVSSIVGSGTKINGTRSSNDAEYMNVQDMESSKDSRIDESKWALVQKGTKIIVQVVKEGLGTKGPTLTAYPQLRSRFWVLLTRSSRIGISKKISGLERTRLRVIAKTLQPPGFGLTVRTVAAGHTLEELQKDLDDLLSTWKGITEQAKSAALAADEGLEGAIPIMLHRATGQTLSVVQDLFNDKVKRMVVDSPVTYNEVTNYLQEIAPDLCDRVELHNKKTLLFDEYNIEEELNNMLSKRVSLSNGGYLVIEQTEALVSIDVNGGQCMLGHGTSQEKAILDVNLSAAKQIAREIRLRDIGGIIVVDFIDMLDDLNKRLVYEEVKKAVDRDRSTVKVSELSRHGLMEITRKRVRPSVTFMISEPCSCCHATGRVEALETSFSKIERDICRLLALMERPDLGSPKSWPKFILRVDKYMCNYLTSGKKTRLAILSSSLQVWILLKVARGFTRGGFELKPLLDGNKDHRDEDRASVPALRPQETIGTPSRRITIFPIKKWKTRGK